MVFRKACSVLNLDLRMEYSIRHMVLPTSYPALRWNIVITHFLVPNPVSGVECSGESSVEKIMVPLIF